MNDIINRIKKSIVMMFQLCLVFLGLTLIFTLFISIVKWDIVGTFEGLTHIFDYECTRMMCRIFIIVILGMCTAEAILPGIFKHPPK